MKNMSVKQEVLINNETGLHARPAAIFVEQANKFKSSIYLQKQGSPLRVNGKSIVFLLSLGVVKGDNITITADGEDEIEALNSIVQLVSSL
jgi:phosphotransferase system HPr (HPr) family protein